MGTGLKYINGAPTLESCLLSSSQRTLFLSSIFRSPTVEMSEAVTIVIDDTALLDQPLENMNLGDPGAWYLTTSDTIDGGFPSNYNNTNFIPDFTPFGNGAWTFSFDGLAIWPLLKVKLIRFVSGTAVSLFGITPPTEFNQTIGIANPSFDQVNITYPKSYSRFTYAAPARGGQFYSSGTLSSPGQIRIGITGARGLTLDYALVTIGEATNLKGQTILVDDSSPEITWSGNWGEKNSYTTPVPCGLPFFPNSEDFPYAFTANMSPHGNTSHTSSTIGDSFAFQFSGTSLVVSGVTPGDDKGQDWFLQMEFTLDGSTATANFTRDPAYVTKPHFTYFSSGTLKSGNHTLVGKILAATGSPSPAAQIDYITYKPSFLTLKDKPTFDSSLGNLNLSHSTNAPGPTTSPSPSANSDKIPSSSRGAPAGAIVGGVVGALFVVASILGVLWVVRRKRKRTPKPELSTEPFMSTMQTSHSFYETSTTKGSSNPSPLSSPMSENPASHSNPTIAAAPSLVEQQNNIAAEIQHLEGQSNAVNETLEARVRELQTQMGVLTREIQSHLSPPSYAG
ncbi:Gpr1 family protein [Mycena venus]|uniref:Gpr1 family protein n=1 Tax=Mycena venus TaxID=2733690 RepID=A0A8H6XL61_9AGAR|nr:Gpr1 family protein [Mycena venus]